MRNGWLLEVLSDIGAYGEKNDLPWLVPLMEQAYRVAQKELSFCAPKPINCTEVHQITQTDAHKPHLLEAATLLSFPSGGLNSATKERKGARQN